MWNDTTHMYSPSIGNYDLHEGPIDLVAHAVGCNGGGLTSVSYTLYLDLDNDDFQETVLTSNAPPPAGRVMANNFFNPGFSGGDTVWFDKRPLPDSLLYRFSLEISYFGDTTFAWVRFNTDAEPFKFSPVQLPEGRHRVEWRIVQDGVVRFCDRNFRVKDCQSPAITCKPLAMVQLNVDQTVSFSLAQAFDAVSDNVTPNEQLVMGIRRMGAGTGFPWAAQGQPQDTVMFSCQNDDDQFVEVWALDKAGNTSLCSLRVLVADTLGICTQASPPLICATTYWNNEIVKNVKFSLGLHIGAPEPTAFSPLFNYLGGCTELAALPSADTFSVIASKDTFPLNGVTTFDLVLISKHILGTEPFDAGWKMTAADANRSGSVTTFDIVELRRLILGITDRMPNNTPSWRFFADTCMVWGTPFFGNCPQTYKLPLMPLSNYPSKLSFRAVKVGDVNGTAASVDTLTGHADERGALYPISFENQTLRTGQTLEVPVYATESSLVEGFQCAFEFDPALCTVERMLPGRITVSEENWAVPTTGRLHCSWSLESSPVALTPGDELFRLRVKALSDTKLSAAVRLATEGQIQPEWYETGGQTKRLTWSARSGAAELASKNAIFQPQPNPSSSGRVSFPLRVDGDCSLELDIWSADGSRNWRRSVALSAGSHLIETDQQAMPQPGVYFWRARAGEAVMSGKLVRD
jgi:hypothetical protein